MSARERWRDEPCSSLSADRRFHDGQRQSFVRARSMGDPMHDPAGLSGRAVDRSVSRMTLPTAVKPQI